MILRSQIVHIFCYSPLTILTYFVLGKMLKIKRPLIFACILTGVHVTLHILYTMAVIHEIPWADAARTVVQLMVYFLGPLLFSREKVSRTLVGSGLTVMAASAAELLAMFVFTLMNGKVDSHSMADPFVNTPAYIMMYVTNGLALLLILVAVYYLWNRIVDRAKPETAWYFMFFPLSQSAWMGVTCIYAEISQMPVEYWLYMLFPFALSVLADWVLFRSIRLLTQQAADRERAVWYQELLGQQQNYYSYILADQEDAARIRHDMRNQLQTVYSLIQSGETDTAREHLDELTKLVNRAPAYCANRVANAILSVKKLQFEEEGVTLEPQCDVPSDLPLVYIDLCSLFSNILDNAGRAAAQSFADDRTVHISSRLQGDVFTVRCENPASETRSEKPSSLGEGQGLGLGILQEIVDRYHGELKTELSGGTYSTTVQLFLS